jgi:hypothetical protein
MKPDAWLLIGLAWLLTALLPASARTLSRRVEVHTGQAELDSLLLRLNELGHEETEQGIGQLELDVYVKGWSQATERRRLCRLIPNLLPFEASAHREAASEALCLVSFQAPCNLQITPIAQRANSRKGRKLLRKVYPVLLPTYAISQHKNDRYYVFPFTDDGLEEYTYNLTTSLDSLSGRPLYTIHFLPLRPHRVLMDGAITLDAQTLRPLRLEATGRIDFGKFSMDLSFADFGQRSVPATNHIVIDYNYAGNTGRNTYDCIYAFHLLTTRAELRAERHAARISGEGDPYDLTGVYDRIVPEVETDWDSLRPIPLSDSEMGRFQTDTTLSLPTLLPGQMTDTLYDHTVSVQSLRARLSNPRARSVYQALPERLMSSSNINAFGTDLKVSGPLDPASLTYDKLNGVCFRERLRWSHRFNSGRSLLVRPDIGYSFGFGEVRYNLTTEWIYGPARRCGLQMTMRNRNSGFSSRFIDLVNNTISDSLRTDFEDLNINYYHHYEARLEQSLELTNGLMGYVGIEHNYRTPVKHGSRAFSHEELDALVRDNYSDFSPYLRLEWQPHQYYHYRNGQKLYISSLYPKFGLEWAQGINGVFNSTGKYGRVEVDVEQDIQLTPNRSLSYHASAGALYHQKGEYFVNYRYFSSHQYPESWNDHIGGVFHLLSDHWYLSSPSYLQTHCMYESPFLLLHHLKPVSKYAIKERVYVSSLLAAHKHFYTEAGYGMGNNYFNVGGFVGLAGIEFMGFGVRATIEIDQHW